MNLSTSSLWRAPRLLQALALTAAALIGLAVVAPSTVAAQGQVVGGDFDICDFCGNVSANTLRLRARAGQGSDRGSFVLVNAANAEQDVDKDGYTPGVDFLNLFLSNITDFKKVDDPDQVIPSSAFVLAEFLSPLRNGFQNVVFVSARVPDGTPAGLYRGEIQVRDSVLQPTTTNPNGEQLRLDVLSIEIEVFPSRGLGLVQGDTAAQLDSLTLRGRPGQTVKGVVRLANIGNVDLLNARLDVTDLTATSGTGLRIPKERISFSPSSITAIADNDTVRIEVTVRIPTGILAGAYRGDLIAQAEGVPTIRVPITVIVTTPGDIVFATNPVVGRAGDLAVVIFNADPGTTWRLRIFDMMAITTFRTEGTVFAGGSPAGTLGVACGDPAVGDQPNQGDEAVRTTWNLKNGVGEDVAGGMYYVIVDAQQCGSRRQIRGKLMVIR